ncbi:hypothetical protein I3760_15G101800 [Carya illinoinensis]|nr:hypothetical protein I3760_15G101800 [Carya illinoinensis]
MHGLLYAHHYGNGKAFGSGRCTCPAASSPSSPTSFVTLFSVSTIDLMLVV